MLNMLINAKNPPEKELVKNIINYSLPFDIALVDQVLIVFGHVVSLAV